MQSKDKMALALFVLAVLAFFAGIAGVWPVLVARLILVNWLTLLLVHLALLNSMYNLYAKAARGVLVQRSDVLFAACLALMASSVDLSLVWKIGLS